MEWMCWASIAFVIVGVAWAAAFVFWVRAKYSNKSKPTRAPYKFIKASR